MDSAVAAEASSVEPSDQCTAFAEMAACAGGSAIDTEHATTASLAPMCEQAEVDAEADKWAECWQESLAYEVRWPDEPSACSRCNQVSLKCTRCVRAHQSTRPQHDDIKQKKKKLAEMHGNRTHES